MNRKKIILILSLIYFIACGTMVKEKHQEQETIQLPKEVAFRVPKALKLIENHKDMTKVHYEKRKAPEHRNFGYFQMKEDVSSLEKKQFIIEENVQFLTQIMDKLEKDCGETDRQNSQPCSIENGQYSFIDQKSNKRYPLGKLLFLETTSNNQTYYHLDVDMSYFFHHREDNDFIEENDVIRQSIHWSKDEDNVSSKLFFNNKITTNTITMDYTQTTKGIKKMRLEEEYIDIANNTIITFYLALQKEVKKERYTIDSQYIIANTFDNGVREKAIDDAKGFLGKKIGQLFFTFAEYQVSTTDDHVISGGKLAGLSSTFDRDGNELNSTECNEGEACDLNDPSTWRSR